MSIVTAVFGLRKRLSEKELEKLGTIIENEVRRRRLTNADDLVKIKRGDKFV